MSESGQTLESPVSWPTNGISEVPFRLYTDPEQYRLEQERIFKGPTWNYLCLEAEIAGPGDWVATTIGEVSSSRAAPTAWSTPSSTAAPIAATCCA